MRGWTFAIIGLMVIAGTTSATPAKSATSATPAASHTAARSAHHRLLVTRLKGVHDATQVISVTTKSYGSVRARVQAFHKTATGWHRVYGPWSSWIGRNGFAPPGEKREGDGRVPSGSYHFSFMFGVAADPGVRYRWRHAGRHDYWDDDSASPRYNTWVNARRHSPGASPEPLHVSPSYDDVAAIAYNTARTPHLGSAIFLHVTHNSPTSGCVALDRSHVVALLRWLRPRDHARIIMGRTVTVTR
jgi:L,D-peptidoglycan transpeptidase YkuD (ErfK/YbiS/YcfS/YnhG family)